MRQLIRFLPLLLLLAACHDTATEEEDLPLLGSEPIDPTAKLTRVENEVFTPSCGNLGCHDPLGHQENLILTAGRSYAGIVGITATQYPTIKRVQPNDPANSYLYRKIRKQLECAAEHPEILLYERLANGGYKLNGVEYIVYITS